MTEHAPTIRGLKQGREGAGEFLATILVTEHAPTIRGLKPKHPLSSTFSRSKGDGTRPDNQGIETGQCRNTQRHRIARDGTRPDNQGIETNER